MSPRPSSRARALDVARDVAEFRLFCRRFARRCGREPSRGLRVRGAARAAGSVVHRHREFTFAGCCAAAKRRTARKCGGAAREDRRMGACCTVLTVPFAPHPALRDTSPRCAGTRPLPARSRKVRKRKSDPSPRAAHGERVADAKGVLFRSSRFETRNSKRLSPARLAVSFSPRHSSASRTSANHRGRRAAALRRGSAAPNTCGRPA